MDIGLEKNGFLHADDVVIPGVEVARRGRGGRGKGKQITELLKPGQEILVQAVKDPLKTKGPRLSMQLSIAGRLLVYVPDGEGVGVSRRLPDKERDRLRKAAAKIDLQGGGAIIRTAAQGGKKEDFEREIKYLHKLHEVLKQARRGDRRPGDGLPGGRPVGARGPRHLLRASSSARSWTTPSSTTAWSRSSPAPRPSCSQRLELYKDEEPLFERYGAEEAIQSTLNRRVDLPERRLPDHRLRRGDDGDRRQLRLVHRPRQGRPAGGHDRQDQPRGRRGVRAPAEAARHRRDHRHRLHRHVALAQPRRGAQGAAQVARRGPHQDLRGGDLAARPGGDDPPERDRGRARDPHQDLPHLRGRGRGALRGDGGHRRRAPAARAGRRAPRRRGVPGPVHPEVSTELVSGPQAPILEIERETGKRFHFEGSEALPIDHFAVLLEGGRVRGRGAGAALPRGRGGAGLASRSRTCTTRTTRWPSSTATSSRSRAPGA